MARRHWLVLSGFGCLAALVLAFEAFIIFGHREPGHNFWFYVIEAGQWVAFRLIALYQFIAIFVDPRLLAAFVLLVAITTIVKLLTVGPTDWFGPSDGGHRLNG